QESGFDEVQVNGTGVELDDELAIGPTRTWRCVGKPGVETQDPSGVGPQVESYFFFLRRCLASCSLS
ncbi:MAG: hypothetical protein ACE10G_07265, partial [Gemmatimonadales bacterium]